MAENEKGLINNQIEQNKEQFQRPIEGMVDLKKNEEAFVPREVKTWMEKVEEDTDLNNPSQQTGDDDSILQPIAPAVIKLTLPTTKKTFAVRPKFT